MLMQQELTVILLEQKQFVTLNPVQDYDYTQQIGTYIIDLFPPFTFSFLISIPLFLVIVIVSNLTELLKMIAKCHPEACLNRNTSNICIYRTGLESAHTVIVYLYTLTFVGCLT